MDLIIELIVWIFKSLSGENQKGKSLGRGGPALPPSPKRGPYNYGDGRAGAPAKPRTLEEILEEVKRQQAQGKAAPAARPNAPRPALVAPPAKQKVFTQPKSLPEAPWPMAASAPRPVPQLAQGAAVQPKSEAAQPQSGVTKEVGLADKQLNYFGKYFKALRNATPNTRAEMSRRAFVFSEVFGEPRSRRGMGRRTRRP